MGTRFPGLSSSERRGDCPGAAITGGRKRRGRYGLESKIEVSARRAPSRGSGEHPPCAQLPGAGARLRWRPRHPCLCLQCHTPPTPSLSPLLSLIKTPVPGFRTHCNPGCPDPKTSTLHLQRPYFQITSESQVPDVSLGGRRSITERGPLGPGTPVPCPWWGRSPGCIRSEVRP